MGLFSNKKEEKEKANVLEQGKVSPPPSNKLPPLPSSTSDIHDIKETISPSPIPELTMPETEEPTETANREIPQSHAIQEHATMHSSTQATKSEPIFVKLNKFKEASENFDKIKDKVDDIEEMLLKIKDIKEKEDQELVEWEHEIQVIKTRIQNIDDSLFERI